MKDKLSVVGCQSFRLFLEKTDIAEGLVRISNGGTNSQFDNSYDYHDDEQKRGLIYIDEGD